MTTIDGSECATNYSNVLIKYGTDDVAESIETVRCEYYDCRNIFSHYAGTVVRPVPLQ